MNTKYKVIESQGLTLFGLYPDTFNHIASFLEFDDLVACLRISTESRDRFISILRSYTDVVSVGGWNLGSVTKYCRNLREVDFINLDLDVLPVVPARISDTNNNHNNNVNVNEITRISSIRQILDNNPNISSISCVLNGKVLDSIPSRVPLLNELNISYSISPHPSATFSLVDFPSLESILITHGMKLKYLNFSCGYSPNITEFLQLTPLLEDMSLMTGPFMTGPQALVDLKVVFEHSPKLTKLCYEGPSNHLADLKFLRRLTKLYLTSCDPNIAEAFDSPFPNLTDLDMAFTEGFDVSKIGMMCPILTKLRLTVDRLKEYRGFAQMLMFCKRLRKLCVENVGFGDPVAPQFLTQAFKSLHRKYLELPNLVELECDVEHLSANDSHLMGTVLPNLESLELQDRNSMGCSMIEIMRSLSRIDVLKLKKLVCYHTLETPPSFDELKFLCDQDCFPNLQYFELVSTPGCFYLIDLPKSDGSVNVENEIQQLRDHRKDVVCIVSGYWRDLSTAKHIWSLCHEYEKHNREREERIENSCI